MNIYKKQNLRVLFLLCLVLQMPLLMAAKKEKSTNNDAAKGKASSQKVTNPGLSGQYASILGLVDVTETGDSVIARVASDDNACKFPKGTVVLDGSRLEDSVTGSITTCKSGPETCTGTVDGLAMLLIAKGGEMMVGAVHIDAAGCAVPIKDNSFELRRAASSGNNPSSNPSSNPAGNGSNVGKNDVKNGGKTDPKSDKSGKNGNPASAPAGNTERAEALALVREGGKLLAVGDAEEARKKFNMAIFADPLCSEAYVGLGVTFYMRERYDDALAEYKNAITANPANPDGYYNTAAIYSLQGNVEMALRYIRIALQNNYLNVETLATDPDFQNLQGNEQFEKFKKGQF